MNGRAARRAAAPAWELVFGAVVVVRTEADDATAPEDWGLRRLDDDTGAVHDDARFAAELGDADLFGLSAAAAR